MPLRPLHPCAHSGCPALVRDQARCSAHTKQQKRRLDERKRPEDRQFYSTRKWREFRAYYLARHPMCEHASDCFRQATEVHHIQSRRDYPELTYVESNVEGLCKSHHSSETAREVWHS
jgi:5-methylcytosine-specific restriction protein A